MKNKLIKKIYKIPLVLLLLELHEGRLNLPRSLLFGHLCLETSEIAEVAFLLPSGNLLGPRGLGPLCVDIVSDVLFTDGSTSRTVGNFHRDICDVHVLVSEHLSSDSVNGIFTKSPSVIHDICYNDQFTSILSIGNVHNSTGMDESFVNHRVFLCWLINT